MNDLLWVFKDSVQSGGDKEGSVVWLLLLLLKKNKVANGIFCLRKTALGDSFLQLVSADFWKRCKLLVCVSVLLQRGRQLDC